MNEKGRFIVVEGIDRSGKSTLSRGVTDLLQKLGYNAIREIYKIFLENLAFCIFSPSMGT